MLIGKRRRFVQNKTRDFLLRNLGEGIHYVQVGANDGQLDDPVYSIARDLKWSALLIEPNPHYFSRLEALHGGNPGIEIANFGISDREGAMDLFFLAPSAEHRYPAWARGCASMDLSRILEVLAGHTADPRVDVLSVSVPVCRLDSLLAKHGCEKTDILVIDVEGHELNVLSSFDLSELSPKLLLVEVNGQNIQQEDVVKAMFSRAGYKTHRIGDDLIGFGPGYPAIDASQVLELIGFQRL